MQAGTNDPRRLESSALNSSSLTTERKDMNTNSIETMFGRIGARVKVSFDVSSRNRAGIDIKN
jgi:hypothetical protein